MAVTKKHLSKVKKFKVILHKEKQSSKKQEEEQLEKLEARQEEQKLTDFKETILEQDIGFAAPVIPKEDIEIPAPKIIEEKEEKKGSSNLESIQTASTTSKLEKTASEIFIPSSTFKPTNELYSSTNNPYSSSFSGTYDTTSKYTSEGLFPHGDKGSESNALNRQGIQDDTIIRNNRNTSWGSDQKELENFSRMQEQYRTDREQEEKRRGH